MLNPDLYPAMFERKSIRHYDEAKPLTPDQLAMVNDEIGKAAPLLPGEKFKLELSTSKEGWRVYGYCENTPLSNANLGFAMQQLDLALHLKGLGRLWYGFGREPRDSNPPAGLSYAICLKVGNPSQTLARSDRGQFDRKPIEQVVDDDGLYALLEPVRLAPSAMNVQPWYFTGDGGGVHVWSKKPRVKIYVGRMHQVDMGIGLCHAVLALENARHKVKVAVKAPAKTPDGYTYLLTLLDVDD